MLKDVSLALEMPVVRAHARSRGIVGSPSYLLVSGGASHAAEFLDVMGEVITRVGGRQQHVYVQAVNEFASLDTSGSSPHDGIVVLGEARAARAERGTALARILGNWRAEAHAILFLATDESALQVLRGVGNRESPWWRFGRRSIEGPYLELRAHSDPIGFFADSHTSFEFYGSEGTIWSLLDDVRRHLAR